MEMVPPVAEEIKSMEGGFIVFDALLQTEIVVKSPVICVIADNPRASEILNHRGGNSRRYCRKCMVDKHVDPTVIDTVQLLHHLHKYIVFARL